MGLPALGQNPAGEALVPANGEVKLDFFFKGRSPERFTLTIAADGSLDYESQDKDPAADPVKFTGKASPATVNKVFLLARQAKFFDGDFEFRSNIRLADMGQKTFSFTDGSRRFTTRFNHTQSPALSELWTLMANISNTLEFIPRIQFKRRFDKLGLDAELRSMEYEAKNGNLSEINLAIPVLKLVKGDVSAMKVVRERADRIIALAENGGVHPPTAVPGSEN